MPSVSSEVTVHAPPTRVWEVLADFGTIERWSPVVAKSYCTTEQTTGVGAERHCDLYPRGALEERVLESDPETLLGIHVDAGGPIVSQRSDFRLRPEGGDTTVTMTIDFELAAEAADRAAAVTEALQAATDATVAGLRYHVETGELVDDSVPGA